MKFNELLSYFKHQLIVKYNLARHELNYNSKLTCKAPMSYLKLYYNTRKYYIIRARLVCKITICP